MPKLMHTESIYHLFHFLDLFLLLYLLNIWETLCMIHLLLRLSYQDHNTINQHFQKNVASTHFFF